MSAQVGRYHRHPAYDRRDKVDGAKSRLSTSRNQHGMGPITGVFPRTIGKGFSPSVSNFDEVDKSQLEDSILQNL